MKTPGSWIALGWFLLVGPVIGAFGLIKLILEFGFAYIAAVLGVLMWISLVSIVFSIIVGILLIRGNILGYHLTKVLIVISFINVFLLVFNFDSSSFMSTVIRIVLLSKVMYSKTTNLYVSELRHAQLS